MTRTHLFLGTAAALAALAVVAGPKPYLLNWARNRDVIADTFGVVQAEQPSISSAKLYFPGASLDLALVIDRSGSMAGIQLSDAKAAAIAAVDELPPTSHLAIVHFGSTVRVLPSERTDAQGRAEIAAYVRGIEESGGTDLYRGLEAGIEQVSGLPGIRRVILLTNGEPTSGITDPRAFDQLAARARSEGVSIVTLGLGSDADAPLLERIAVESGGHYVAVARPDQLTQAFHEVVSEARSEAQSSNY